MSSGYERIYGNSFPNVREPYNPDPYYNRPQNPDQLTFPFRSTTSEPYIYDPHKGENVGNFSPFYIAITICTIIGFALFILNIFLGCCSRYSEYWNDRHTGNRWIVSLWTATPHKQPALDYSTELQEITSENQVVYHYPQQETSPKATEFLELRSKRESEI
ncbi:hypothetical protein ABEB36_007513 [Hypothenemus hampei]|uniref:Uncharacterized protein n=1 Tax=Hypothenemus hampei TaxID=57062 RepID=A0ABD1EXB7_HYPHA